MTEAVQAEGPPRGACFVGSLLPGLLAAHHCWDLRAGERGNSEDLPVVNSRGKASPLEMHSDNYFSI